MLRTKSDRIKKEAVDARSYGMVLDAHGICKETASHMVLHADLLSLKYNELTKLAKKNADASEYLNTLETLNTAQTWFAEKVELAKKMCNHAKTKPSKKAAAKPK